MKYILLISIVGICCNTALAQSSTGVRVSTVPRGTPTIHTNIPADAPSRKFMIDSDVPVKLRLATEIYENHSLTRIHIDYLETLDGMITPEVIFRTDPEGNMYAIRFYYRESISSVRLSAKIGYVAKGVFGDGISQKKGQKVPIALLYHEEKDKDDIASLLGAVGGVAPSGSLYQKIEALPVKLENYIILYYTLEDVEE